MLSAAAIVLLLAGLLPASWAPVFAAGTVPLSTIGLAYTQDFDTLANTGTGNTTLPLGWALTEGGGSSRDNEQYAADDGSSLTGDTYSYGAAASTERAFGELRSGNLIPIFGASFTNSTGASITSIDVAYTGEQWRLGAVATGRIDRIDFQISTDATSLTSGTWVDVNALDFTDPITGPAAAALDGNTSPNRTALAATIAVQGIASGSTFWIRWTDVDAISNDDGLAVDDFSLTPHTTNPSTDPTGTGSATPSSVAAGGSTLLTVAVSPGTNPTSTGLAVAADLGAIGGSGTQSFFDDGTHGDATSSDNVFSFQATVAATTGPGSKSLQASITDAQSRTGAASIALEVVGPPPALTISEVYGGGGNAGATLKNDFIELYNPTASAVSLAGWSVQYASATGSSWQVTPLTGSIPPGRNYLVQEAAGTGGTVDLPTPDATGTIPMSATAGKVALVNTTAPLSGTCPTGGGIVDFVGYGTTASCFEGTGRAPAPTNTTSDQRIGGGATDTNDNAADFVVGAPDPHPGSDQAPTVASTFPANGATDVDVSANLTVTFSEPVNVTDPWFNLTCNGLAKPATYSGTPTTFTIDPVTDFADGDMCSLTVIAANVADQDAVDPPDTMTADFTVGFTAVDACVHTFTPIYDIQGSGDAAAITGNVTTAGVVVGDFEGGAAVSGFYLQDATGDGDPATSDGIFVYTGGGAANTVSAGELVRVTGFARERFNQTTINGADNNNAAVPAGSIVHCGTGSVPPTQVTMPFASTTFPERYEGMLVTFPQPLVISEYFNYERFGEIVLAQPLDGEDRPYTGTAIDEPGAAANARTSANAVRRITLDDNVSAQNPVVLRHPNGQPFSLTNRFRGGDTVANTTGVLGFDFSLYRIYPTAAADYTAVNPRPAAPDDVGGTLRAAAMNTLNFFLTPDAIQDDSGTDNPADNVCGGNANLECRGWDGDQPAEFDRQRDKLLQALAGLDADVIGLNEIENTPGVEPLLDPTRGVVAGLNAMPGVGPYDAIDTGVIGTDAIRVGIIYRSDVVRPVGAFKLLNSTVDPRFIDTKNRPSIAQTFDVIATGARFTVVVNHLKSKGSDCNDVGDRDTGDGQGNCAGTRLQAAKALVDWIATDPTGSGDRDYLILGDLNSYAMEDSVDAIKAGPDDTAGTADDFTNLIAKYHGLLAHSYVFNGESGYLDHALASPTLLGQVSGAADWHINSDEPDIFDYDTTFKPPAQEALYEPNQYRTSDHDPVVVGLNLLSYHFSGFEAPVDNPPTLNIAKAGQSVPVKFHLAGDLGLDVLFGTPSAMQHTCAGGGPSDNVDTDSPGGSGLQFDPTTNTYTYVWKTDKLWTNQCRTFEITFDDGTYRRAEFSFKK